jgi:hypothetical protein
MTLEKGVDPKLLAAKAAQYANAKDGVIPKYIKYPDLWLEEERWREDPQPRLTGKSKPPTNGDKKSPSAKASKSLPNSKSRSKPDTTKLEQKKKPKSRDRKKRTKSRRVVPESVLGYFPLYCDYLGITLMDLATAINMPYRRLKNYCSAKLPMPPIVKFRLQALVIDAVQYRTRNEPLTADWLRRWYEKYIKSSPPKGYKWRLPNYYRKNPPETYKSLD